MAIGGEEALRTAVLEVLRDRDPNVKRAAYLAGMLRLTEAVPLYELSQAGEHHQERVRAPAVKSLALVGTPRAFETIRGLADDPSRHVRACVAGALRKQGS